MEKLAFADGEKLGVIENGKVTYFESGYITRYRDYVTNRARNDEWKVSGEGARFRGDADLYAARDEGIYAYINGVDWDGEKLLYAFTINNSSGVYRKDVVSEKAPEEHIFSASDTEILSVHLVGNSIAVTVRSSDVTSEIGTLDAKSSELRTLTGGDARDANARFSAKNPAEILFDSAGVGRTANGEFTGKYAPSVIYSLHRDTLELTERKGDGKWSYIKPKEDGAGNLYCIRRPNKEKGSGNLFLDIILFPFRILKAIFGFLQAFTMIFGNTSLTSASEGGNNPTKGRKTDTRKLYVDGKLLDAEKEQKQNKKFKDREYGFIPASWKLVKCGDSDEVVASGVCDFALGENGAIYYTDGRHIYRKQNGKETKLTNTECCLAIALKTSSDGTMSESGSDDFFS